MTPQAPLLEYYREILPDPEGLQAMIQTPLPSSFWANPLKIQPEALRTLLEAAGFALTPLPWHTRAFRCDKIEGIGQRWEYLTGLMQVQEEVSMLPLRVLAPRPGERVLDLCAAPGNKTAEAAVMMQNTGTLVANDCNYGRMRAMGQMIKRLGLVNISLSIHDAAKLPKIGQLFDKIIADVPCSCEGTFRKHKDRVITPSRDHALRMAKRQKAILKRAVQLCRPGGRIVYSTCTFSPEENEAVVSDALHAYPGQLRVVPIQLDHFVWSPGITAWYKDRYDPAVKDTMRVWPHQNNTGGFYVALLEKCVTSDVSVSSVVAPSTTAFSDAMPPPLEAINARFGLDAAVWENYQFSPGTKKGFYLTNRDNQPPALPYDATGLFFLKTKTTFPKLTTAATMLLGQHATVNTLTLTEGQLQQYLTGEESVLDETQLENCTNTGYVIVRHAGYSVGMGLYLSAFEGRPPRLKSLFPKYF